MALDFTLDDDIWKDSFDKILEPRNALREMKILTKNVRASFNIDSSVENCSRENSALLKQKNTAAHAAIKKTKQQKQPKQQAAPRIIINEFDNNKKQGKLKKQLSAGTISTPILDKVKNIPFKCSLSPVGIFESQFFHKKRKEEKAKFHSTVLDVQAVYPALDYANEELEFQSRLLFQNKALSPLPLPIFGAKKKQSSNKPQQQRHVCFNGIEQSANRLDVPTKKSCPNFNASACKQDELVAARPKSLALQPGKWRKSLHAWRRTQQLPNLEKRKSSNVACAPLIDEDSVKFVGVTQLAGTRKTVYFKLERSAESFALGESICSGDEWKSRVLKYCKQRKPRPFEDVYSAQAMQNCRKIGEGAYGEVFLNTAPNQRDNTVLKIIPIEGEIEINGEIQKTFEQILPEVIISMELSKLYQLKNTKFSCSNFVNVEKVCCVQGAYPKHFLHLWQQYDNDKGSENDNPEIFTASQLYIVLELGFSGSDMETFIFSNAEQSYYALQQIILTLAIGEAAYNFEHRDLHWGNVLLLPTSDTQLTYKLNDKELKLPTKGLKITIIDYTLSRMTFNDCCLYNDLSADEELFTATGDYQFDIYRMMRDVLKNNWGNFVPKTNVFWISYIITKMLNGVSYRNVRSKIHANYMAKLKELREIILDFESSIDVAKHLHTKLA